MNKNDSSPTNGRVKIHVLAVVYITVWRNRRHLLSVGDILRFFLKDLFYERKLSENRGGFCWSRLHLVWSQIYPMKSSYLDCEVFGRLVRPEAHEKVDLSLATACPTLELMAWEFYRDVLIRYRNFADVLSVALLDPALPLCQIQLPLPQYWKAVIQLGKDSYKMAYIMW